MKNKLCCLLLLLITISPKAWGADFKITGEVYCSKDSIGLIGATVEFLNSDSVVLNGVTTDLKGVFRLQTKQKSAENHYLLRITYLGYKADYTEIIGTKNQNFDLGKIYLQDSLTELSEVVITSTNIIEKSDRMLVTPTSAQLKSSSNSMDLLNNMRLPGLTIDIINQKAQVDGMEPIYLVNGRQQTREQVMGISTNNIRRVEFSNSVPIRYMNQNVGGVINIILKEQTTGGSTYLNATASPMTGFLNGVANTSYNFKKSEFLVLYTNNWRDYSERWRDSEEKFIADNEIIRREGKGDYAPFGYLTQNINLQYSYIPDNKSMLNIIFKNQLHNQYDKYRTNINETIDRTENNFYRSTRYKYKGYFPALDIFYSRQLKNAQSLEFNIVGSLFNSEYDRNVKDEDILTTFNNVDNERYSLIAEGVYKKQLSKNTLSFGVRNVYSYTKNQYKDINTTVTKMNAEDGYLYGQFAGKIIKTISYDIGGGLKIYDVNDKVNHRSFYRGMLTANALYAINRNFRISYRFQLQPTLPSLSQLSDVIQTYDNISIRKGNPDLNPYNSTLNRLLFIITKNKLRVNLWASYYRAHKPISLFTYWDNSNNYFVSEYLNQKYNDKLNLQIDISTQSLFNHISFNITGGWNNYHTAGEYYKHSLSNFYWNANITGNYKSFTLTAGYTEPQKKLNSELITSDENNSYITLMYRKKQLILTMGIYYPFTRTWYVNSESLSAANPYTQKVQIKDNGNMFVLGFTYSFQYGKQIQKKQKQLNNVDYDAGILRVE